MPGRIEFRTTSDGSASPSERMRIDSSGNVGIGTTSPDDPLTISRATTGNGLKVLSTNNNTRAQVQLTGKDSSGNLVTLKMGGDGDTGGNIFTHTNHRLGFATNNAAPQLILDTSGRLLLGTTTEGHADSDDLTIATSGRTGITIRSADDEYGNIFFSDGTSGADEYRGSIQYYHSNNSLILKSNAVDALTIDSSQNATFAGNITTSSGALGIGDTTPNYEIHVKGADAAPQLRLESSAGTGSKRIDLFLDGAKAIFGANQSAQSIAFQTGYTDRLTIANDGSVTAAGTVSDSKGNLRSIPRELKGSAYTLVAADAGKCIRNNGGVTVPNQCSLDW